MKFAPKLFRSIAKFKLSTIATSASRLPQNKLFLFAALIFSLSACHTLPKPQKTVMGNAGSAQGQWRAKALVKNLKNEKSVTLDLDMVAQEPDRLRVEALGPFSTHVASIASRDNKVRISLTREKKFIESPADRYALSRLVPVRVAPADLLAILFDRPLEADHSGWKCDRTSKPEPEWSCQSGTATVARQKDEDGRRRFLFTAPDSEMDLVITEAHSEMPLGDSAYTLEPTRGFRVEHQGR